MPKELVQRYENLDRTVGDLSVRNKALEDQLQKAIGDVKSVTGQLRSDEEARRSELERNVSQRNRLLEEELQKASFELKSLKSRVEASEQAQRAEQSKVTQLVDVNRDLVQQVRKLNIKPRYCDKCGRPLVPTGNSNVSLCPSCDLAWTTGAQSYALPQSYAVPPEQNQQWYGEVPQSNGEDYAHPGSMHAGRAWHGIFIHENCGFCGQTLQLTTDPSIVYCPYCERYQPHVHK
jgi:predicted Zn-ribbon and HTH transcriptional regulator